MCIGVIGLELDRLLMAGDCFRGIPEIAEDTAEVGVHFGKVGLVADGGAILGNGLLQLPLFPAAPPDCYAPGRSPA